MYRRWLWPAFALPGLVWLILLFVVPFYAVLALALSMLIGYPVAYYVARHAGRMKAILLVLIILPLWISYMMRMLAWVNLLAEDGYVNRFLTYTNILSAPHDWLGGRSSTVILALVYGYIPSFILR